MTLATFTDYLYPTNNKAKFITYQTINKAQILMLMYLMRKVTLCKRLQQQQL